MCTESGTSNRSENVSSVKPDNDSMVCANEDKFRVFISYSHDNSDKTDKIIKVLEMNNLDPLYDRQFISGQGFHAQIQNSIAHSHVFVPIITEESSKRGWVHQEIGYAMAFSNDKVQIAIKKGLPIEEHITILGNWFVGKAVSATLGAGYSQTIFTRHAPTIQCAIEEFDQEMEELLTVQKIDPSISMEVALKQLRQIISELDEDIPKSASTNKKA